MTNEGKNAAIELKNKLEELEGKYASRHDMQYNETHMYARPTHAQRW